MEETDSNNLIVQKKWKMAIVVSVIVAETAFSPNMLFVSLSRQTGELHSPASLAVRLCD